MSEYVIVVEQASDWKADFPRLRVVTAREYLEHPPEVDQGPLRVINLCRSYGYLSVGYYCSLLAEARRHKVVPTVRTIQDLSRKSIYSLETADVDRQVQKVLGRPRAGLQPTAFELTLFFGQTAVREMQDIGRWLFEAFRAPLLRVEFRRQGSWRVAAIKSFGLHALDAAQQAEFFQALESYLQRPWRSRRQQSAAKYYLAILHNPDEQLPPSSTRALRKFIAAARKLGIEAELIQRRDYGRLAEYDALFIRETTAIDHYTYQFAKKADSEDLIVLDDPDSILKCTNKVYLAELLRKHRVPTPRTVIVSRDNFDELEQTIPYPVVLKIPDGSFSRGVFKAASRAEARALATRLFRESDLILAQEFMPTEFDWRIGVLNKTPIYACQYFMSRKHWQIVDHTGKGRPREGGFRTLPVAEVPKPVVRTALKAANLIGDGLYGVDLKQTEAGVFVIEVNDNPNVDAGVEDAVLKDELYRIIMLDFLRRLDSLRGRVVRH
ncbi:MAG: RimK family protein [Burkholderiales bacterium]|nr:MAG: RimK family protein [Burkholderiales bacterium]